VIKEEETKRGFAEDEDILIREAQRDSSAFRPLYEKYFKSIFLFVHYRVGDKSLSADITSQVFLKALLNLKKFELRGLPFSSWLFRIALNECHDFFRKTKRDRLVSVEDHSIEKLYDELTADATVTDLHDRLPIILERLTPDELQFIELRFFEQRPFKEIADIIGISENYAKVKVYRILEKMKKLFLNKQ
jgi:RNA polymerase sigma-70 factor, ECF subfamily